MDDHWCVTCGRAPECRAEIERLRAALQPFARVSIGIDENDDDPAGEWFRHDGDVLMVADFLRARRALGRDN